MSRKTYLIALLAISAIIIVPLVSNAAELKFNVSFNLSGIFLGIWHGLLAPYSLVVRWFLPGISMYSCQDASWFYDFGFLLGAFLSLPIGWIAVIFALIFGLFA